jgi:hypothetical protein
LDCVNGEGGESEQFEVSAGRQHDHLIPLGNTQAVRESKASPAVVSVTCVVRQ